jgi:hypothetical protein
MTPRTMGRPDGPQSRGTTLLDILYERELRRILKTEPIHRGGIPAVGRTARTHRRDSWMDRPKESQPGLENRMFYNDKNAHRCSQSAHIDLFCLVRRRIGRACSSSPLRRRHSISFVFWV